MLAKRAERRYHAPMLNTTLHGQPTDDPPLVIVHGLYGSARNWGVIARRLSDTRQVVVGPKEALSKRVVPVREINWLGDEPFDSRPEWHLSVKVRSTRPPREAIVRPLSDHLIVMKEGEVVESGSTHAIFEAPRERYTRELMQAAFAPDLGQTHH